MSQSNNQLQLFQSIGQLIVEDGEAVRLLLSKFGIKVNSDKVKDLSRAVLYGIDKKGKQFHYKLAALLLSQRADYLKTTHSAYDSFADGGLGLVAGMIGSVANLVGAKQQKQLQQQQARSAILSQALAFKKAEQDRLLLEKQRQLNTKKKINWTKTAISMALALGVVFLLVKLSRPIHPSVTPKPH